MKLDYMHIQNAAVPNWWSSFKSWLPFSNKFDRCDNNGKYCSLQVEIDSSMAQVFWLKNLPCSAIICFLLS